MDSLKKKRGFLSGNLEAKGATIKKWAKFYFECKDGWLHWYKDESSTNDPLGSLPLGNVDFKQVGKKDIKRDFGFQLSSPQKKFKEISLSTTSQEELDRWMSAVKDAISIASPPLFGLDLELASIKSNALVPSIVTKSIEFLQKHITLEGLFRISGVLDQVNEYRRIFDSGLEPDFSTCSNPHNVTNVLKLFLRELPDPLFTYERYHKFVSAAKEPHQEQLKKLPHLIEDLPLAHRETLNYLLKFLKKVSEQDSANKMTALNLAVVFGPTILKAKEESLETAGNNDLINAILELMIKNPDFSATSLNVESPSSANQRKKSIGQPTLPGIDELSNKLKIRTDSPAAKRPGSAGPPIGLTPKMTAPPPITIAPPPIVIATPKVTALPPGISAPKAVVPPPAKVISPPPGGKAALPAVPVKGPAPGPRPLPKRVDVASPNLVTKPLSQLSTENMAPGPIKLSTPPVTRLETNVTAVSLPLPIVPVDVSQLHSPVAAETSKKLTVDEKMKALEEVQTKNADLIRRIQKHLEL